LRSYVQAVPRRFARPPRSGRPLAEQLRLSHHAVERFRRRAPELAGDDPRQRLAELVEREGAVLAKPPSWFQGNAPAGGFLIGIRGRYVMPVRPVRSLEMVLARPWRATTFISRVLSADDLRELTGDELAALTLVTGRVARRWTEGSRDGVDGNDGQHQDAVVRLRRELAKIPEGGRALSWAPAEVAGRDELHVALADGTLVLVRPRREEQHPARFRTVTWLPDRSRRRPPDGS
jgi:hypothetical protein